MGRSAGPRVRLRGVSDYLGQISHGPRDPPVVYARPEEVVELAQLRRREVVALSDRLARVASEGRAKPWSAAGSILVSVGGGALIAAVPLLSSTERWDSWVVPTYAVAVVILFVLSALCWLAARTVRLERADSVAAIKIDLDRLLDAYDEPAPNDAKHSRCWRQMSCRPSCSRSVEKRAPIAN